MFEKGVGAFDSDSDGGGGKLCARGETTETKRGKASLTPKHRLRQLEASLFFKGQTTSLLASVTEKELVSELRGGMVHHPRGSRGEKMR